MARQPRDDHHRDDTEREKAEGQHRVDTRGAQVADLAAVRDRDEVPGSGDRGDREERPADGPRETGDHRSHTLACAGWTVSRTAPTSSARTASRSTSSRRRTLN